MSRILLLAVALAACSKSTSSTASSAIAASCHNPTAGLCFQYVHAEIGDADLKARICRNDPGATWRVEQGCPVENVALECQLKMGPFLKEERTFLYANNTHAKTRDEAVAYCAELASVPVSGK